MATSRNIEVVYTIRDRTKAPLKKLKENVKQTGKAANTASLDFKGFNRTLFATTAFIATFTGAFFKLKSVVTEAANFDKVNFSFERFFGSDGKLIKNIRGLTNAGVDEFAMMQSAIKMRSVGMGGSTEELADTFAMAAAAAKRMGMDSREGFKAIEQIATTGSMQAITKMGMMAITDPGVSSLLEIMKKSSQAIGGTISTQAKLGMATKMLGLISKNYMRTVETLNDVVQNLGSSFTMISGEIGSFIAKALTPVLLKIRETIQISREWFSETFKGNKNLMFLTRTVIAATSAVGGLILVLGSLYLTTTLLSSVGLGIPVITGALVGLATIFTIATSTAGSFTDRLEQFGAILKGAWQILTSFNAETGKSQIDRGLRDFLKNNGILEFTTDLGRAALMVKSFFTGMWEGVKSAFEKVLFVFDLVGFSIREIFEQDTDVWQNKWLGWAKDLGKWIGVAAAALAPFLLFAGGRSLLGKIPVIGKLFGGGKKPTGTQGDPIHTKEVGGVGGGISNTVTSSIAAVSLFSGFKNLFSLLKQSFSLGGIKTLFKDIPTAIALAFPKTAAIFSFIIKPFKMLFKIFPFIAAVLKGFLAASLVGKAAIVVAGMIGWNLGKILLNLIPSLGKFGDWIHDFINEDADKKKFQDKTSDNSIFSLVNKRREAAGKEAMARAEFDRRMSKSNGAVSPTSGAVKTPDKTADISEKGLDGSEARVEEMKNMLSGLDKENEWQERLIGFLKNAQRTDRDGGSRITDQEFEMFGKIYKNALESADQKVSVKDNPGVSRRTGFGE